MVAEREMPARQWTRTRLLEVLAFSEKEQGLRLSTGEEDEEEKAE